MDMQDAIAGINKKLDGLNEDFFINIVGTEVKKGVEELKEHIDQNGLDMKDYFDERFRLMEEKTLEHSR